MLRRQTVIMIFVAFLIFTGCAKQRVVDEKAQGKKQATPLIQESQPSRSSRDTVNVQSGVPTLRSSFIAGDVFGVVVVHPRGMLSAPLLAEFNLARLIDETLPEAGVSVADIEQAVWLLALPERLKPPAVVLPSAADQNGAGPGAVPIDTGHVRGGSPEHTKVGSPGQNDLEPPVNLDDLFQGLEPARPIVDEDVVDDAEPVSPQQEAADLPEESALHAFDVFWTPRFMPMILRFAESSKANQFSQRLTYGMREIEFHGARYYAQPSVSGRPPTVGPDNSQAIRQYLGLGPMSVYLPDAHTVVMATEDRIQSMLDAAREGRSTNELDRSPLRETLDSAGPDNPAMAVIDFQLLRQSGMDEALIEELSDRFLNSRMALFNLADDVRVATLRVDVAAETFLELEFRSRQDPMWRTSMPKSVSNFIVLLTESYEHWKLSLADPATPELASLVELADQVIHGTTVENRDATIIVRARRPEKFEQLPRVVEDLLERVVGEAEEALWRHSLERIAWAMRAYAAEHARLPPAALYDARGKPLLSWRVLLLPYLGHDELYGEFKLDEAWNSVHNISLLDRMPSIYGRKGAETRVMLLTGPGTLFEGQADGTAGASGQADSKVLLVRTACDQRVAWTTPIDIDVSKVSVVEALGTKSRGGFLVAFGDGTVRKIPRSEPLGETIRRALPPQKTGTGS